MGFDDFGILHLPTMRVVAEGTKCQGMRGDTVSSATQSHSLAPHQQMQFEKSNDLRKFEVTPGA